MNKVIKSNISFGTNALEPFVINPDEYLDDEAAAELEVQDIVSKAKQKTEIIIHTARTEAKDLLDNAYADGYKAGAADATQAADELLVRLEQDINDVAAERAGLIRSVEEQVLMLCMECVEKIIRHEIKTDPEVVSRGIKFCLRRVKDRDEVAVRVSPKEVAKVRSMRDELLSSAEGIRGINIVDDRRITPGGCVIESPSGDFDAKIETQVEKIRRKLMDVFANEFDKSGSGPDQIPNSDQ